MGGALRGRFLWHEVMTSDVTGATAFYTGLAGWGTMDWAGGSYTLLTAGGMPKAGLMALPAEMAASGVPPHWLCYFGVEDCDAAATEVTKLGGTILRPPGDIPQVGRFAVAADPQGAAFCLYTPGHDQSSDAPPGPGDFTWHELGTTDPVAALRFYGALLGWTGAGELDMGPDGMYYMFGIAGGPPAGGMMVKPAEAPVSYWLPYIHVPSADAAAEYTAAQGGKVIVPPMEVPGGDRITVGVDPQGAVFAVHAKGR